MNGQGYILVVNDNDELRHRMCEFLQALNRNIKQTATGVEGLTMCRGERPALVVLDYNLKKDGEGKTARHFIPDFRRECPGVPILVVSATDLELKPEELGVEDFLAINGHIPWGMPLIEKARKLLGEVTTSAK